MNQGRKPQILITNDDSISAGGIAALIEAARPFGDLLVVAPDKPQSGMGHAITIHDPIRLAKSHLYPGVEAYACSGTPVDCVKLGIYELLGAKPDLILSGINHGENSSTNVLYSGTMSAAIEGAMEGVASFGFSLADFSANADFSAAQFYVTYLLEQYFQKGFEPSICLNVNVPKLPLSEIKGLRFCKQAHAYWADRFEKRTDQFGRDYFWLTGEFADLDQRPDTDLHALKEGFVSVVPTQYDLTAYAYLTQFKSWEP